MYQTIVCICIFVAGLIVNCTAQYEDVRCKCVCPSQILFNGTTKQRVFIGNVEPNDCKCEFVVRPLPPNHPEFCPLCECKYERRNTRTIKVMVIMIITIVAALFVYMLFLLCLDPLMSLRSPFAQRQPINEIETQEESQPDDQPIVPRGIGRQMSIMNRVTEEQRKWKGTVSEQRKNIYERHSMLN